MDLRRRAVLGTFLFNTAWAQHDPSKGFQARSVWSTAPQVFQKLWPTAETCSPVAALCNSLVQSGYLYIPARVNAIWRPTGRAESLLLRLKEEDFKYKSPVFAPTEAGILHLLTSDNFDQTSLVKLGKKPHGWNKMEYDNKSATTDELFKRFIKFDRYELDRLVAKTEARRRKKRRYAYAKEDPKLAREH